MEEVELEQKKKQKNNENNLNFENTLSIGIDFGTKKTISAIWNKSKKRPEIIKDPETNKTKFPSVINFSSNIQYFENNEIEKSFIKKKELNIPPPEGDNPNMEEDKIKETSSYQVFHTQSLCPDYIDDFSKSNLNNNIYDIKKVLGEKFSSNYLQNLIPKLNYQILENKNSDRPKIKVNNKEVSFEQITSFIFKKVINNAEKIYNQKVSSIVISVPNNFCNSKRQSIIHSANIAGIKHIHLLNDTTAGLIYYIFNKYLIKKEYYLVIDLGAANLDLSLIEVSPKGYIKVIYSMGYGYFGGDNITEELLNFYLNSFCNEYYIKKETILENKNNIIILYNEIEKAKINLIYQKSSYIHIDKFDGENDLDYILTRTDFDTLMNKHYNFIIESIDEIFIQSKFNKDQLNNIILLGEHFKLPKLIELISQKFDYCNIINDYDEAVTLGCAIYASKISNKINEEKISKIKIYEITQLTLGIRTEGNLMSVILPRGSKIPIKAIKNFITTQDYQNKIKFEIYEGERKITKLNNLLCELTLKNLPECLKGEVSVDVIFEIDSDGILTITAIEKNTKMKSQISTSANGNLTTDEIKQIIIEAEKAKEEDEKEEIRIRSIIKFNDDIIKNLHIYSEIESVRKMLEGYKNWLKQNPDLPKEEYEKKNEEMNNNLPQDIVEVNQNRENMNYDDFDDFDMNINNNNVLIEQNNVVQENE